MPLPQSCGVLGLDSDDDSPTDDLPASSASGQESSRWQVVLGSHNPFLDLRRPGDPGGPGFYKLFSQVSLLESRASEVSMSVQAVTPAGLDADGVQSGPTIVTPSFSWACDLNDCISVHAFISKNIHANSRWAGGLGHPHYGLALESAWPFAQGTPARGPSLFLEALSRPYAFSGPRSVGNMDLVPGIHWRLSQNWWFTSGILMPLTSPRLDANQLQITCSWQF